MLPAARLGDNCTAPHVPPVMAPGTGMEKVLIGNQPAWRANLDRHACTLPIAPPAPAVHGPEAAPMGSMTVLIGNQMACRATDLLLGLGPPNPIMSGDNTVLIGNPGFGMKDAANLAEFCADMRALASIWGHLAPAQRLARMQKILNKQLAKSGTPPVRVVENAKLDKLTNGQLNFTKWRVEMNPARMAGDKLSPTQARNLANTLYHEARHAEQWFAAGRVQAGAGVGAAAMGRATGLPAPVVRAAQAAPLARNANPMAVLGGATNRSVYGSDGAYRNDVLTRLDNPADQNAYSQYRGLPEEQDAWATGDATGGCM